jgi:hypothetical protein
MIPAQFIPAQFRQECLDDLIARGCDHDEAIAVFDAFLAMTESMKKLKALVGDDFALDLVESAIVVLSDRRQ